MWDLIKTTPQDAEDVCHVALQEQVRGRPEHVREWVKTNMGGGPAFTGRHDKKIVFVGGIRLHNGMGQLWAIFSPEIRNCKKVALHSIQEMLEFLISTHRIKRLLATCQPGFREADTLIRHLGFQKAAETFQGEDIYIRDSLNVA